jgi:hypothetical protein
MPNESSEELYRNIIEQRPKEVELVLSKIEEMLNKDLENEDYEDCARLRDMREPFKMFLKNELQYDDVKDNLSFAKQKLGDLINDAISKAKNKKNKILFIYLPLIVFQSLLAYQ